MGSGQEPSDLQIRVLDARSDAILADVLVLAARGDDPAFTAATDSAGLASLPLTAGRWRIEINAYGYRPWERSLEAPAEPLVARLTPLPLVMEAVVVRARREDDGPTAAFVERIPIGDQGGPATDLAEVLDQATGVDIRRYGGLGAFSSISIRGSTSEQVLVFLDGVPLNQAVGGGVDLGSLPVGGVESVDVYRGAVPGRFGGNSLGGVVHLRTASASGEPRLRLRAQTGAFSTRGLSASLRGRRPQWDGLVVIDLAASDNDFRFWDDNGTEYNATDDVWATRRNSDFLSLRGLAKLHRSFGSSQVQLSLTHDLSHRGLPGIGNFQALHTRFDSRRQIGELNLYGSLGIAGRAGYRLKAYHSLERSDYKDLLGEVGVGQQHDRNRTTAWGLHGEANLLVGEDLLGTMFSGLRRERFSTRDRLEDEAPPSSRRLAMSVGGELEKGWLGRRLVVNAGLQLERIEDNLATGDDSTPRGQLDHSESLWSTRLGLSWRLSDAWTAQGHVGRYARAPGFYELFGDRGAVLGNTDLVSERGRNRDAGVVYRPADGDARALRLDLLELVGYDNDVDDLIRFIQNSQRVSRPHNIGGARLRGVEARAHVAVTRLLRLRGSYARQRAENRSPFSFERGNLLPNAPQHRLQARLTMAAADIQSHYVVSHGSRHFLDRANQRPVPVRTVHGAGLRARLSSSLTTAFEIRNLTDDQVADLWGYPLPGRSWFLSFEYDLSLSPAP